MTNLTRMLLTIAVLLTVSQASARWSGLQECYDDPTIPNWVCDDIFGIG